LTLLTFASPILYPEHILSPRLAGLLALNPYTHLLRLYRSVLPGAPGIEAWQLLMALLVPVALILAGTLALARLRWAARDAL
jgi:ABC-type polysaccharide/polyol phosphate export permease